MSSTPFGEHLKREREMRGVTLEEISAATRIAPRFLLALENEQWDQLPGGVFNRGFIRAIARFLGLDEDTLVSEYALETKGRTEPGVVADPPMESSRRWSGNCPGNWRGYFADSCYGRRRGSFRATDFSAPSQTFCTAGYCASAGVWRHPLALNFERAFAAGKPRRSRRSPYFREGLRYRPRIARNC